MVLHLHLAPGPADCKKGSGGAHASYDRQKWKGPLSGHLPGAQAQGGPQCADLVGLAEGFGTSP